MALRSICPRCAHDTFEICAADIKKSNYVLHFIRCSSCGCVINTVDAVNTEYLIRKLAKKLNVDI